jgi:branched-chain amino acid transport system ATP-binding protein
VSGPLLELKRVTRAFGGLRAVADLDFALEPGLLAGLIGPNGAGKTTVFNLITGVYAPTSGEIRFEGKRIDGRATSSIARAGIARTFQNPRIFAGLTCLDNVRIACHTHAGAGLLDSILATGRSAKEEADILERSEGLLRSFALDGYRDTPAGGFPTASSGGSRSRGRSRRSRGSSSSTSPRPASIRTRPRP